MFEQKRAWIACGGFSEACRYLLTARRRRLNVCSLLDFFTRSEFAAHHRSNTRIMSEQPTEIKLNYHRQSRWLIGERLKGADKTVSRPRRLGIAPSPSGGRLGWGWGCTPCTYTLPLKPIPSLALPLKGRELLGPSQSSHDRRIGQTLVSPPHSRGRIMKHCVGEIFYEHS